MNIQDLLVLSCQLKVNGTQVLKLYLVKWMTEVCEINSMVDGKFINISHRRNRGLCVCA